ncbi:two-component regulator propeller domain-containing protein [Candidatus Parabeggiatoa sp. HSG14]|uniref:two-component regulator propeller domain-containing protein n=1 Tax=Candidatus Parabeggiatoa sp. HSG14 TaxID=3055593 RepID=UPI0025A8D17E|nr:two-component regulator propeller domain-containing protein [Thiotrichales bacterium HSG14]
MKIYFKLIFFILGIVNLSVPGYAQQQEIKFEHLSRKDGLSQSTVYAILQDNQGFMWFGTQDGLNKYDGYTFTHYRHDPQNPDSLGNSFIYTIYEDSKGDVWIGTDGGGLDKYDRQRDKFIHYRHDSQNPNSLSSDTVLSIYEDFKGILWISTYNGLNKFDRDQNKFVHYQNDPQNPESLSSDAVWRIYEDSTHTLWIGADSAGLNKFNREQNKFVRYQNDPKNPDSLSNDHVSAIYEDSAGKLWIGTSGGGLNQFNREQNTFVHYVYDPQNPDSLSNDIIWSIFEDSIGNLWIGTDDGLNQFNREQNRFVHYFYDPSNPNSLSNNYVMSIYEDRAGALWIGTDGGSLNKFDRLKDKFIHYSHDPQNPNSLSHNTISSIYEDSTGVLWIGTLGGGLNQFDPSRKKVTHYFYDPKNPNSLSHDEVWSIYEDHNKTLWVGTYGGGLNKFDRQQNQFIHYRHNPVNPNSLSDDHVRAIYEDSTGTFWIGTREGLNKFDRQSEKFVHYQNDPQIPNSLSGNSILSIYEDSTHRLWIGTQEGGLNKFEREQNKFMSYLHDPQNSNSLSHNEVFALHEDITGVLWIGTLGGGLNKFDPKTETFTHYREKDGLPNDVINGILEDNQGNLWLSTNKGISQFNPTTATFRNYDILDGLQNDEFRTAYYKNNRGELFFGGINGFNVFYPENITDNPYVPPIMITDFKIFNQPVTIGDNSPLQQHINVTQEITLSYKQSFFSFEFAALNFLQPEKNEYAYKLVGLENEWNNSGTRRNAYYTSVPTGTYTFRVKGSNNDKIWNEDGTSIKITVLPPFWKTWWAYTFYVLAILVIIFNYIQIQRKKLYEKQLELEREKEIAAQLKETDRLKDEFLANTSHELRTPLNGIIGLAESLIDGAAGPITQILHSNLSMIAGSGHRLLNLVNDILDFSKLKKQEFDLQIKTIDIRSIAQVVLTLSQPLIGHKKVQLVNAIPSDLSQVNADENRVQQILYNLVGNAIKFTESGTVEISAKIVEGGNSNSQLAITVSDTGIGIPEDKLGTIFEAFEQGDGSTSRNYGGTGLGLAVTQQLVQLHKGEMQVQSQVGKGSQFTFTLPLSEDDVDLAQQAMTSRQTLPTNELIPATALLPGSATPISPHEGLSLAALPHKEFISTPNVDVLSSYNKKILHDIPPIASVNPSSQNLVPTQTALAGNTSITTLPEPIIALTQGEFTILIVDDEPVNRQVILNHLSLQNYTTIQAESGIEALAIIEGGNKPDLILLDIMMPQMSGYEVTQKIRETWQANELPIILLTAKTQVSDLVVGFESGANDYLTKPVSKDELLVRIKTHLHILQLKAETLRLAIENKNRLTQFLESVPVGIGILDSSGTLFYHNQKAKRLLGKEGELTATTEEIVSVCQFYIVDSEQPYPTEKLPIVRALGGEYSTIEDIEIHRNDKIIPLEMWGSPIFDEAGEIVYTINTLQDITERKQAIETQKRFTEELFKLNTAYERFVPREFLSLLDKNTVIDVNLGDQVEKEITVLFSDIRDFTTISESMTPQENFDFINSYLSQMEPVISEHHGFIDKYIGDAIMALFPTSPDDAVRAGIAMLKKLDNYNEGRQKAGYQKIRIGIGLNAGPLMLGTVGGQNRMDGTVIADVVNVASRVEGLTKTYGTPLLITESTYKKLTELQGYHIRVIDAVKVKGKTEEVTVYEVYNADFPESLTLKDQTRDEFEQGFVLYHCKKYQDAHPFFGKVLEINKKDKAAQIYLERCQKILERIMPLTPSILIVDDSPGNIRLLQHMLTQNNFKLLIANRGERALDIVQKKTPHLILLDIMMPGMDGYETCRQLKADQKTRDIPIIFMTALTDTSSKVKGFEVGAVDYITKPFQLEEVLARIKAQLKLSHLQKFQKTENY